MRIGRTIIDTDNMTIEEIAILIKELREIRARKIEKKDFCDRMTALLAEAKDHGFTFIDKDFGQVMEAKDLGIWDEKA